jgi:hypothetical protein
VDTFLVYVGGTAQSPELRRFDLATGVASRLDWNGSLHSLDICFGLPSTIPTVPATRIVRWTPQEALSSWSLWVSGPASGQQVVMSDIGAGGSIRNLANVTRGEVTVQVPSTDDDRMMLFEWLCSEREWRLSGPKNLDIVELEERDQDFWVQ